MSFRSKQELLLHIAPRYQEATELQKGTILNEFVAATGYARKYAIRLLNQPGVPHTEIERPRAPHYGPEVQEALHLAWLAANRICAKRLVPFLPTLIEACQRRSNDMDMYSSPQRSVSSCSRSARRPPIGCCARIE